MNPTNVTWDRWHKRWLARVMVNGKSHFLGRYIRRETAVEVAGKFKEEVRR